MARNVTHLRAALAKALETAEEVHELKGEAISNCESDSKREKMEEQGEILQEVWDLLQEASDRLDDYEA